ncbi:MAG: hydroxymethylglutaryl-CoA synthase, partial [Microbacteriaceae bacterium]
MVDIAFGACKGVVVISVVPVGISDIAFSSSTNTLDLNELAIKHEIDVQKYYLGIGQREMSVPTVDEDIVTMAANAAQRIVDRHGVEGIHTLLFATETGIDQSKAAGVYVHRLVGLSKNCRVVELKQACYSATAGLQMAAGIVARDPKQKVLVIASDVARYEQDSAGEPTQGAGAVAILVTANPAIIEFDVPTGLYTEEIMDFWRPNYSSTAFVDGKYSIKAYLTAVDEAWADYRKNGGSDFSEFDYFCYHQPFTKMAVKAHAHLNKTLG